MADERAKITGVVLAGGKARRMGGVDKGLMPFRGHPLAVYALDALRQIADTVLINANRNLDKYARFGYPVISDLSDTFDGPLAGLLSAMRSAQTDYVLTIPCDCPLIDGALLGRLYMGLIAEGAEICSAHDGERLHPVFLIAECGLADDLAGYLASDQRKVETWLKSRRLAVADFSDHPELFFNINSPRELNLDEMTIQKYWETHPSL